MEPPTGGPGPAGGAGPDPGRAGLRPHEGLEDPPRLPPQEAISTTPCSESPAGSAIINGTVTKTCCRTEPALVSHRDLDANSYRFVWFLDD